MVEDSSFIHCPLNPCTQKDQCDKTQRGLLPLPVPLSEQGRYFRCFLMTVIKHLVIGTRMCLSWLGLSFIYSCACGLRTKRTWVTNPSEAAGGVPTAICRRPCQQASSELGRGAAGNSHKCPEKAHVQAWGSHTVRSDVYRRVVPVPRECSGHAVAFPILHSRWNPVQLQT